MNPFTTTTNCGRAALLRRNGNNTNISSSVTTTKKNHRSFFCRASSGTNVIQNRVIAPPRKRIQKDSDSQVFCPSKVSRIQKKKKRRRKDGPGGPEDSPSMMHIGDYGMPEDEDEEFDDDTGNGDDGNDDISNNGGGGDDGNDDNEEEDDDDEFDEKWESIIKRFEDNYQNLEAVKTVSDPYAGLNGVSGELSVLWSAGCVVTYASAIAHSLDTMISPFLKGERDGFVDIA
jgi:hypothetical protein